MKITDKIELYNCDNMELMAKYPDNYFDLAVVDPPYNVGASDGSFGGQKSKPSKISGKLNGKHYANHDKTPDEEYFKELFRVSKNQIIWGANYYPQFLNHSGAIVWDKLTTGPLSDCELAYQSFNKLVTKYTSAWSGFNKGNESDFNKIRVHPNQKPVNLYSWLLQTYAKQGEKILDTHLGSMSIAIACHDYGFELVGCELDKEYYNKGIQRVKNHVSQQKLF